MHKLNIVLETVTPLFLGGANPRGTPELRPAPFRGALRFWLRALLGGILGDDVQAIKEAESKVFGSTQYASPITVRVSSENAPVWRSYRPLLHNPQRTFVFKGIETGYEFTLQLRARSSSPSIFDVAAASLALLVLLGGVGKRSRRGFGTLRLKYTKDTDVELWRAIEPQYDSFDIFRGSLTTTLGRADSVARAFVKPRVALKVASPSFPILDQDHAKILLCERPFSGWETAMKTFWGKLRSRPYRDDPVFGFAGRKGRQASPLHLRVVHLGKKYYLLMTAFRVLFRGNQPNWSLMQRFLDECQRDWNGTFVYGGAISW